MGMFDTIYFDKAYTCPICQKKIYSTQTKAFENLLEAFHVKDCVGHAEEMRIVKEELFCDNCSKFIGKNVYIVVGRGILLGITETLEEAKELLNDLNPEKMILWYHDLYRRYIGERKEKHSYGRFLEDLREWYGERLHERPETDSAFERIRFIWNSRHLKGALNPVESIERFLTYEKMRRALAELWEEGHETLDIYYPEDMSQGEESWSVDVYQDELNDRCGLNWTWTVISKRELETEGEEEDELPEWEEVVDEPFSDEVVCKAIEKWLRGRGYEFGVRMIELEQARGSGLIKRLRERGEDKNMVSATRISKIVGVSEEEIINKSLISFIEREIRLAEADIADIRERYNVISKEELYEAIKTKKIASHPAWEDYIVWKNKERYMGDLNRWDNAPDHPELHTFPEHFHNGSDKDVKESELNEDYEEAIRDILGFIQRKLAEYGKKK